MDFSRQTELVEGILNQLIDEETLGVCFEMHRAIRLEYYELLYPEDSVYEKQPIVEILGLDIFGNAPQAMKKSEDCLCPNCSRTLGAQKFAPHLEKCMGMGRNSSRLASKRQKTPTNESEQEVSDDNEDDWTYHNEKNGGHKKSKKEKILISNSPRRGGNSRAPGKSMKHTREPDESTASSVAQLSLSKPSLQQHNAASFSSLPIEHKQVLFTQMCGVVSERTGRLCTRSINCPQHSEDQRQEVRQHLLEEGTISLPPEKRSKESSRKSPPTTIAEDLDVEGIFVSNSTRHSSTEVNSPKKKKNKSGKKAKKGHGSAIVSTSTLLHSNMF